jgi:hypothetical protein
VSVIPDLARLELAPDLHLARLLILLRTFAGRSGEQEMDGLTKLAKLDFLLRYPTYLERALRARKASTRDVQVQEHERHSVESEMIRYRFGPWDERYRNLLNALVAKGLVTVHTTGRTIRIRLTPEGVEIAETLMAGQPFTDLVRRSRLLRTHFNLSSRTLMDFIYSTFPEIATLRMRDPIAP